MVRLRYGYANKNVYYKSQVEEPTPPFCLSTYVHVKFLGVAERVLSNMRCCSGSMVPRETRYLEDSVTSEALQSFLSRMVKRGGAYRWSCENLNGGLGWSPSVVAALVLLKS